MKSPLARATLQRYNIYITGCLVLLITLLAVLYFVTQSKTHAANKSDWVAGNIISDENFTNSNSMSVEEIQAFLDAKIGTCDIWGTGRATEYGSSLSRADYAASKGWPGPPYTCLNKYYEVPKLSPSVNIPANNYSAPSSIPNGAQSAAWIIKNAADLNGISPKVLLVKIATESLGPLTSDNWPLFSQYRYAMGSHCPDSGVGGSANCDSTYAGFSIQIYSAAELLRWYLDNSQQAWWPYKKPYQNNTIQWNVTERGCGSSSVYIQNKATAALYTYTPYQPNDAALNNMYGTGNNCSAYGNRNFWRVYWDWFGDTRGFEVSGAILQRYQALGSASGMLGTPTSGVRCGLKNNGCYQPFQNGAIYWSPSSGAWESNGNIRARYQQLGFEQSALGYPTGAQTCGIKNDGCYQPYQFGYMYWSNDSGAWESKGGIRERYISLNVENGPMGYPTGPETCGLQNGGCYQSYQTGAIYWSPASGAWENQGGLRYRYGQLGFENSSLGYPTGAAKLDNGIYTQPFQNGALVGNDANGYWDVKNAISAYYQQYDPTALKIGFPVHSEVCNLRGGGCYQPFQSGAIYWSPASGTWESKGGIRSRYEQIGFEQSPIGYPTGTELCGLKNGGCAQPYQWGALYWSPASGAWEVKGAIRTRYEQLGSDTSSLGYPTQPEICGLKGGGCFQPFQNGGIYWSPTTGVWESTGPIRTQYAQLGFEGGRLGYPISAPQTNSDSSSTQRFKNGVISISAAGVATITYN